MADEFTPPGEPEAAEPPASAPEAEPVAEPGAADGTDGASAATTDGTEPLPGTGPLEEAMADAFAEATETDPERAAEAAVEEAAAQVEIDLDLASLSQERDEYLDALRRLQADFENYKKRMQRQQAETVERAGEDLAVKLLPVLDTIDLATQHGEGEAVAPLASALIDVLTKEGLERIDPVGEPFDPNEHEAVSHEPGEGGGEPVVAALMRAGYRWKGRLLRAAMVTVRG